MEKKKPPHTEYEKHLLIQLIQQRVSVLDSRKTDGVTIKKKHEAWEKLTLEFNSSPNITQPVTSKQLKKMWQNLKTKARDAKTIANQANKTGGGPQPPQIGALESQVLAVIPNVMPTIAVDIDSDMMYVEDHETEEDDDSAAWLTKKNRVTELEIYPTQEPSSSRVYSPQPSIASLEPSSSRVYPTQPSIASLEPSSSRVQPPQPSITSLEPSSSRVQPPQASIRGLNKRKERNVEEESIDGLRKKIYQRELEHMEEKFEFEKKLLLEKHSKEMEILEIKNK